MVVILSELTLEQNFGPEVKEKASIYVPAIGKVTIVVLLRNLLRIVQNRRAGESNSSERVEKAGAVEEAKPSNPVRAA
jgi:methylenetetrahydrofolate dehydrogenase (NAD+)